MNSTRIPLQTLKHGPAGRTDRGSLSGKQKKDQLRLDSQVQNREPELELLRQEETRQNENERACECRRSSWFI